VESPKSNYKIASFTKRGTRKLSSRKKFLHNEILPKYAINDLAIKKILLAKKKVNLEIGFGSGEFLFSLAKANPNEIFIGCEPFETGVLQLIDKIEQNGLTNIYILADDVFLLLDKIPNAVFSKIYILFPDPWPKLRHHKRRIISQLNLDIFISKMLPDGQLKIATDHYDYASWIIAHLVNRDDLKWIIKQAGDVYQPFKEYVITKYYRKAKTDDKFFFDFKLSSE
jgi:tRNA (guanine-N7-)-methyltransferase